jgi:hypothetical protein
MNKITIAKEVYDKTPEEFKNLTDDSDYTLTKAESNRKPSRVNPGQTVSGTLEIIGIQGNPAVRVTRSISAYIRTSPIVKVLDKNETTITFETEGRVYKLEKGDSI